jgi:hypothetical protein
LHWDERVVYLDGLAQLVQLKYPRWGAPAAASSPDATMDGEQTPQGLELFQQLGGHVRTEEVVAE